MEDGTVFQWGQNFRNEALLHPELVVRDDYGIIDLQVGQQHILYIQEKTIKLYSFGDSTLGQTGNNFADAAEAQREDETHLSQLDLIDSDSIGSAPAGHSLKMTKGLTWEKSKQASQKG